MKTQNAWTDYDMIRTGIVLTLGYVGYIPILALGATEMIINKSASVPEKRVLSKDLNSNVSLSLFWLEGVV